MPTLERPRPYDPMCKRLAADIEDLDSFVYDSYGDYEDVLAEGGGPNNETMRRAREDYIVEEEGTYNPETGHYLCDSCYIKAGQPTGADGRGGPGRWVCP